MPSLIIALYILFPFLKTDTPQFEEQVIDNNISIGYGIALGDVDGDGKPDILLADKKQFVWYRNGDWKKFVLAENITQHDNVCIAARDINGDGKVEIAVGAQWNPSETSNAGQSGSVHYLLRPADPTQLWKVLELPHEPTVHRMKWIKSPAAKFYLLVVPLHGRGNKNGEGVGVNSIMYEFPKNVNGKWAMHSVDTNMHLTHNFDIIESGEKNSNGIYLAGKEGVRFIHWFNNNQPIPGEKIAGMEYGAGEVRAGKLALNRKFIVTIEPMHGDKVVAYSPEEAQRTVLDDNLKEGHALAVADFLGNGSHQVVAGWRSPNKDGLVGIKLYQASGNQWQSQWVDRNGMACEDIQVMDLNNDGKPDIVAAGRATHNLKVYWNSSK